MRGIHFIYNRDFKAAEKIFKKIISGSPSEPAGYFYLAMVTWSRLAAGFWSPDVVKEYTRRVDKSIDVAKARIDQKGEDAYDYFYLGGALGFKGRFELSLGNYLASFFLALDAINALKTCHKMNPENRDVMLGLGIFDYYTARLSGVLKFFTYLLLHQGDKEEGLRKLHMAAEQAPYSGTEAKSMLLHIYLFLENQPLKALQIADYLTKKYQKNSRYALLRGVCQIHLERYNQYRETVAELRQRASETTSLVKAAVWTNSALYLESIYLLYTGEYAKARSNLEMILDHSYPQTDPAMIAWPLVKIGMSHDLEGNREEAKVYYQKILEMENGAGAQFLVKKLLHEPPKQKDPFIGY